MNEDRDESVRRLLEQGMPKLRKHSALCGTCHSQTDTYGGRNGHRRSERHLKLVEPLPDEDGSEAGEDVA
jgi:hypothetical protein